MMIETYPIQAQSDSSPSSFVIHEESCSAKEKKVTYNEYKLNYSIFNIILV
jgi:hypothetical protein